MNTRDIRSALVARLMAANILPAALPNGRTADRPYVDVQTATARRETVSMKGGDADREIGSLAMTVVIDEGIFTGGGYDYADQIAALFPAALRLPIAGGVVTITGAPDVRPGFNADAEYRVPVIIPYTATATA